MDIEYDPKDNYLMIDHKYLMGLALLSTEQKGKLFGAIIDKQLGGDPEIEDTEIKALYWIIGQDIKVNY